MNSTKVVILAGGKGTRLSEETYLKPKPMVEIDGKPIIWHIMKIYSNYGLNNFIICCGYKGFMIKHYFKNYFLHQSDVVIDMKNNKIEIIREKNEPWHITLVDTGQETMTGGRLLRIKNHLIQEEQFCLTYGDGVADININELISSHNKNDKYATLTAVRPKGRYGNLDLVGDKVKSFQEKNEGNDSWINGGFFVFNKQIFNFLEDDNTILEREPMNKLVANEQLMVYRHQGFWQSMDTLRDKIFLEDLIKEKKAPWMLWENE